ncbi:hypothetical protein MN116_008499 [Schistosoma mekongi]|uniref:PMP-22/EMP/MP20/Claudin tight junction n=1 Tax=Schistosoma mekongi TaxID=38744 RepID=A0AAE2D1G4_SCHME|nr:hypothetical protein MN116_008499 [Schistosoma mekongi]
MRIKHRIKHSPFSECRYRTAYISTYAAFVFLLISFVTPYWLQSWPRLHTPFLRLGLWEFCVNGFVQRLDPNMVSYYGCWWILSPYLRNIFTDLVPFWFLIIQVMVTISLCLQIVAVVTLIAYMCKRIRHVERQSFFMSLITFCHSCSSILLFISVVIFGVNYQNEIWMPYPTLNWPSWSYGFAILAGFASLLSAISFGLFNKELRRDIQSLVLDFPMSTNVKTRRRWKLIKRHWPEDVVPVRPSTEDEKSKFHSGQKYPLHSDLEVPPSMEKFSEYSYSQSSGDNLVHGDGKTKSYHGSNRQDSDV